MAMGLMLKETMSGWATIDGEGSEHAFAFSIGAFTTRIFTLSAPRYFKGKVHWDGLELDCHGELTIHLSGPHYWLEFRHPELGKIRAEGKKDYGKGGLIYSLTTCPMVLTSAGRHIGDALVAYRDSMVAFPFKALRLVREENAFSQVGASS